jgi:hypothetical protein
MLKILPKIANDEAGYKKKKQDGGVIYIVNSFFT